MTLPEPTIVVIGASSGPGLLLFNRLRDEEHPVIGIARTSDRISISSNAVFLEFDASDTDRLAAAIPEGATVVHCSRPEILTALLKMRPAISRLVAIGSTRIYTRFPDDKCARLTEMTHTIWMGELPATILHPTMIYGAPGLNNVERIVSHARRLPWIPLPKNGDALIQPVHAEDVVEAIYSALMNPAMTGKTIVVPGPEAVTYRRFIEMCISIVDAKCRVISLPYPIMLAGALLTSIVPFVPKVSTEEVQRLLEDKAFDVSDLNELLGVRPRSLSEGLRQALQVNPRKPTERF